MANIYLANAESELRLPRRLVVIKEVIAELAHDAKFADMLVAEAKLAAELDHANVVKVEDLGRDGTLFIAMEYVEGVDLREIAPTLRQGQARLAGRVLAAHRLRDALRAPLRPSLPRRARRRKARGPS